MTDTTLGGGALSILNEQNFVLTGGTGNNVFTITTWTGTGTIIGGGGQDTVEVKKSANMGVNGSYVGDSDGMLINTSGIAATVLQAVGSGNYSFTVNAWNANGGALWLNGGTGTNTYNVGTPQTENLDTILQTVNINAARNGQFARALRSEEQLLRQLHARQHQRHLDAANDPRRRKPAVSRESRSNPAPSPA